MEIRLLGNLEVVVEGMAGTLPGAGERALLALLALQRGRVVSADRLVDALWGERLPANPANALQTRVSKLRRALAALGADDRVVETVPPGYRLALDLAQVDALRFERDVRAAREAADGDQHAEAQRRYAEALAAWRGPALADFVEHPWAGAESRRLDELRLTALQERIELDLRDGRHLDVVGELEALLDEHPLRERLYAQLMLALYRGGRQADALAVYQRARQTLDAELGLDPSAELRELEAAILRQDDALAAPARAAAPAPRHGDLPERVASFVGRDQDVEDVSRLLAAERLVTVTGPGGAGKTTLALEVARRARERFDDGAWFVDLTGATEPEHVAGVLADTLELPAVDGRAGESRAARLARQLHGHRCLLVLDNCEHVIDAAAELVDRVLAACPGVRVLATSREALAVAGEVQYALAPLSLDAAVALFVERAQAASRAFADDAATRAVVEEICAHLDGMPLAIELAAARTKTLPAHEILARLGDRFRLLSGGSRTAQARHQTLRATVDWSYELLSEPERTLLRRLSVFRGSWTVEAAERVCADEGLPAGEVLDLLGRLVDRSLVATVDGRFRLLETVRDYAAERLAHAGETEAVRARNLDRLLALAERCEPELRGPRHLEARRCLTDEHDDLRAALSWCANGGDLDAGRRLASALAWFWFLGDYEEGRRNLRDLLCPGGDDDRARARALQALSIVERPGACVVHPHPRCAETAQQSLERFEREGDEDGAALSRVLLAVEATTGRDIDGALGLLEQAAVTLADDAWSLALIDFVRMEILVRWREPDEALAWGDRAFERFAELREPWGMSAVRAHQGASLRLMGRYADALARLEQSLDVARAAGLQNTVQGAAGEAGLARASLGDDAGARAALAEAAEVARRYGFVAGVALSDLGQGWLALRVGDTDSARPRFQAAVDVFRDAGGLVYLASAWSGLGWALDRAGELDAAEKAHGEVLAVARLAPDPALVATALEGLAGVAAARSEPMRAAELLGAAGASREQGHRPVDPLVAGEVERAAALTRDALGAKAYKAAVAAGREHGAARHLEPMAG